MVRRDCPDCDVPLESVEYDTNVRGNMIRLREGSGLLGRFGYRDATNVGAFLCSECDRVLFYADE